MINISHKNSLPAALIFDMDGVLVNSNPFHLEKWVEFLTLHSVTFERDQLPKLILGQRNDTALRHFFGQDLSMETSRQLGFELEEAFRKSFKSHATPLPGLEDLIVAAQGAGIPMAVASSAMLMNVDFVVDALGFREYFKYIVSGDDVSLPKPDPEIYLKAAQNLGLEPQDCVAFEDSFVGIESAKGAGMKCVAIASSFPIKELTAQTHADLAVPSFQEVSLDKLRRLFL
jgi:HAD superfamily hydrolase (TIGR01509 family)